MDILDQEARAFDEQIRERIKGGHKPDLRLTEECRYFYNNPWRHPHYVKIDIYEQYQIIRDAIQEYCKNNGRALRILEVGCGPGHLSLELARNGYDVIGLDLSPACIEISQQFADSDPWKNERGLLKYVCADFLQSPELERLQGWFDAVVFLGALHHFPEQVLVMKRVSHLLTKDGIVIAHEPTRDRVTMGNTALMHLVKVLLFNGGGFYEEVAIPESVPGLRDDIHKLFMAMRYENEDASKVQSVNDNEAGFKEMRGALLHNFDELNYQERYAFFHEIIGGLRYSEEKNLKLASYLKAIDKYLCDVGVLQSTEFFFVGRKKDPALK